MHPSQVLFQEQLQLILPSCDHYAGSEKLMRKSMALQNVSGGALFDVTFDCEDGASAGNEFAHAHLIGDLIASGDNKLQRIGVRVHDVQSIFFEQDIATILATATKKIAYIVLPKVASAAQVSRAITYINALSVNFGRDQIPIHVLVETHNALAEVHQIAALPQVECLSFGIMDFVSAHQGAIPASAMRSPGQFTHPLVMRAKLEIAAACHRYGKTPSHNVTTEIKDTGTVFCDASRAIMECGYTRMWSIHPSQIQPIIKALAPCSAEIDEAVMILNAAQHEQWGPVQINGRLHDRASYRHFWIMLKKAQMARINLPESAQHFL